MTGPITEDWLRKVGFKWHQLDRQPNKHWLLWLGRCIDGNSIGTEDLGLELAPAWWKNRNDKDVGEVGRWHCWLRSDVSHLYGRFLHVRYLRTQDELISLIVAITGTPWNPENNLYGAMMTDTQADAIRRDIERLDRRMLHEGSKWRDIEKDDSRGGALPEHLQAHEDTRVADHEEQ